MGCYDETNEKRGDEGRNQNRVRERQRGERGWGRGEKGTMGGCRKA